jgi:proline iminopeptidase
MKKIILLILNIVIFISCSQNQKESKSTYLDSSNRSDKLSGGVKVIPIKTPEGTFNIWTKRVGNNPSKKVLLLHGGPGANHEYFQAIDSYFPNESIEYYYYDQLGSAFSDKPKKESLWTIERFVDEVEQVRLALALDSSNLIILGHSWGGILGIEYALKYQKNIKALIISNMVPSIPDYVKYANDVLATELDQEVLKKLRVYEASEDYTNPEYLRLIHENYYPKHVLRMPLNEWPDPVKRSMEGINYDLYLKMQGPSEFGIVGDVILKDWNRKADLPKLTIPILTIGGAHDTMDPKQMEWMSTQVQNGTYLHCPNGSHFSMYDDQETYFNGLTAFINSLP